MSCSSGVVSPRPRVVSPGVWSLFARTKSPHLRLMFVGAFFRTEMFKHLFLLFICVRLILRSIRKTLELDLILFIFRSRRKRLRLILNPRAKRLHTPGGIDPQSGRSDSGRTGHRTSWKHRDEKKENNMLILIIKMWLCFGSLANFILVLAQQNQHLLQLSGQLCRDGDGRRLVSKETALLRSPSFRSLLIFHNHLYRLSNHSSSPFVLFNWVYF